MYLSDLINKVSLPTELLLTGCFGVLSSTLTRTPETAVCETPSRSAVLETHKIAMVVVKSVSVACIKLSSPHD